MAESSVPIQPTSQAPQPPTVAVKTFTAIDVNGQLVQIQGVVPMDDAGRPLMLLTEATGQQILAALNVILQQQAAQWGVLPF